MKPPRAVPRWTLIGRALPSCLVLVVGCATIDQLAPPVDEVFITAVEGDDGSTSILRSGRHVYVTSCARCHSPEAVTSYSRDQWRAIMPRMADEAGLSVDERDAVTAYVMAVLTVHERVSESNGRVDHDAGGSPS